MKKNLKSLILIVILLMNFTCAFSQKQKFQNEKFVIVLDVQQYWTETSLTEESAAEMLTAINALIGQSDPDKVIYVTSAAVVASLTFKGVKKDTLPDKGFTKTLKVVNNNVFEKKEGDAFTSGEMMNFLEQNNVKEIILTGILAEKCVKKTALGGISRDYSIYIIPETIGAKSEKSKNKILQELTEAGVKIIK